MQCVCGILKLGTRVTVGCLVATSVGPAVVGVEVVGPAVTVRTVVVGPAVAMVVVGPAVGSRPCVSDRTNVLLHVLTALLY